MKNIVRFFIPVFGIIFIPLLIYKFPPNIILQLDKKLYFASFVLFLLLILFNSPKLKDHSDYKTKFLTICNRFPNYLYLMILFLFTMVTQNYLLNYETISWDIPSYLVATYDISQGNLPYTTQWETKGPLLIYIYYFISLLAGKSYIIFRILNDIVLYSIAILIFKISLTVTKNDRFVSFCTSLLFLLFFGMEWYISEFSELYCLVFIGLSYYKIVSTNLIKNTDVIFASFFISLSSLINQVSAIFIIPIVLFMYLENKLNKKSFTSLIIGGSIPQLFFLLIYLVNGLIDVYIFNYFILPFTYAGGDSLDKNLIYEFIVWLRELFNYENFLYFSIFTIVSTVLIQSIQSIRNKISNSNILFISGSLLGVLIYFIGGWGFAHHLFYFIFFFSFLIIPLKEFRTQILVIFMVLLSSTSVFFETYSTSTSNLINYKNLQENYPLYKLSNEINSAFEENYNYEIFALEYVLILYYLDKPNFSYIIHPTNHFQDYITTSLIKYNKIKSDNVNFLLQKKPDVILCNPQRIHMGKVIKNDKFSCDFTDYADSYYQFNSTTYKEDKNIEFYYDSSKSLNLFIKNISK